MNGAQLFVRLGVFVLCALCMMPARALRAANLPLEQMAVPEQTLDLWGPLPEKVKHELRTLLDGDDAEVDRLLASQDAREVGLGLFILDQRGDLARLVTLVDLLDDARSTIPCAAPTSTNHFVPHPQTVREYLSDIYASWFALSNHRFDLAARPEHLKNRIREVDDPWALPSPWLRTLRAARRAGENRYAQHQLRDPLIAEIKAQIIHLPSDVRWAVIASAAATSSAFYSREEARSAMTALDSSVRDQILTGDPLTGKADLVGWSVDSNLLSHARELLQPP